MSEGSIRLRMMIAGILGVVILRNSIEEQAPSCVFATPSRPVAMASCLSEKKQGPLHLERKDLEAAPEMPFLLRTSSANSFNHQYVPGRREFIQPEHATNVILLMPPCPEKTQGPLHLERKDVETAIPQTGAMELVGASGSLGVASIQGLRLPNHETADFVISQEDNQVDEGLLPGLYVSAPGSSEAQTTA
jgi:hypothetical protein